MDCAMQKHFPHCPITKWFRNNDRNARNSTAQISESRIFCDKIQSGLTNSNFRLIQKERESNKLMALRISDVFYWKNKLKEICALVEKEIHLLSRAKEAAERALQEKTVPHEVNKFCLVMRDRRANLELAKDTVEKELWKESRIIDSTKNSLNNKCNECFDLLCTLYEIKNELESDFSSKQVAESLDCDQYYLHDVTTNISLKPVQAGTKESLEKEEWIRKSEAIIKNAECQVKTSQEMCDYLYKTILRAEEAVQNQKQKTDSEYYRRTNELGQAIEELQWQKKNIEEELTTLYRLDVNLRDAQEAKKNKLKLVETRIENRNQKEKREKIDGKLEKSLVEQRNQLKEVNKTLEESIINTKGKINGLKSTMRLIEDSLREKSVAQQLDQTCMEERKRNENKQINWKNFV